MLIEQGSRVYYGGELAIESVGADVEFFYKSSIF
jgi:hypothetical protein